MQTDGKGVSKEVSPTSVARTSPMRPPTGEGVGLGHPVESFLARMGRSDGGRDGRELQMPQHPRAHRLWGDGGNNPQRATLTKRAGGHIQVKHALEQPGPAPARRGWPQALPRPADVAAA